MKMNTPDIHIHAVQFEEGEEVIHIARRHWFPLAMHAVIDGALFFFCIVGAFVLYSLLQGIEGISSYGALALCMYLSAGVGLFLWMHFFALWTDHWLDAWVITNKRVIDIEQHGFFRRTISSFPLDRIQDVTCDTSGVIAMWLHFGDVRIQTASISEDLIMRQVGFPEEVKEHIVTLLPSHGHQ
jgi:membrane protein YdbS with pleckstrin-like domain